MGKHCKGCENPLKPEHLTCGYCNGTFDKDCTNISMTKQQYNFLKGTKLFMCEDCIENKIPQSKMSEPLEKLFDAIEDIRMRVGKIEKGRMYDDSDLEKKIETIVVEKMNEILHTDKLRESKRYNILIGNLPSTNNPNPEVNKSDDLSKIKDILEEITNNEIDENQIESFFRLNKGSNATQEQNAKPSFLKIVFKEKSHSNKIIRNSKKLKDTDKAWMKDLFIFPDLVFEDRVLRRKLIEERNDKNSKLGPNEKKWTVRGLKLLQLKK